MYRVIQYATGSVGRTSLRRIIDHPDLDLVGVYVHSAQKAGLDAGRIAKRADTGVRATSNLDEILALDADVVMHAPLHEPPFDSMNADVIRLLRSGKNVISLASFQFPAIQPETHWMPLMAACLAGNSTLAGTGVNPGFMMERLALTLTGLCAKLDRVRTRETADISAMPSAAFVFDVMGFGADPAQRDITAGEQATLYTALFSEVLGYCALALGSKITAIEPKHAVTLARENLTIAAGVIRKGTVSATEWRLIAHLDSGPELELSVTWTAEPGAQGHQFGHWAVDIIGRPSIKLTMDLYEPDPNAPQSRAAMDATAAMGIAAIPEVCAAPPGLYRRPAPSPFRARFR